MNRHTRYNHSSSGRYRALKASAQKRNYEMSVTKEQYEYLTAKNKCYYCSRPVGLGGHGLDRIDNSKGYTPDNVVPCCGECNMIKGNTLSHVEAIAVIGFLQKFRKESGSNV